MNPFLELPELWSEFHSRMIVAIADAFDVTLSRDYRVVLEKRVYEQVQERFLEIREVATGQVITVIELLSPKNKRSKVGREAYLQKRHRIMMSQTHLVEIDLLRGGEALPITGAIESDYRILVSASENRPKAQLYAFNLRQVIPAISIPLAANATVLLELQPLLHQVYDRARLELAIDYQQQLSPKLSNADVAWISNLVGAG